MRTAIEKLAAIPVKADRIALSSPLFTYGLAVVVSGAFWVAVFRLVSA